MNINQLIYASGEDDLRAFILKFVLPMLLIGIIGVNILGLVLLFMGMVELTTYIIFPILSPFLAIMLTFGYLYMEISRRKESIEDDIALFVTFLGTIAQKDEKYSTFFKNVAESDEFGEISLEMKKVFDMAVHWKLGYAEACRVVASITPSELFSNFLVRMSNVIEYGEDLGTYLINEQDSLMREIELSFQESIYFISTVTELFSALIFAFAFLAVFGVLLPIFVNIEATLILFAIGGMLIGFDIFFIILGKQLLPKDKLTPGFKLKSEEQKKIVIIIPIAIFASLIMFTIATVFSPYSLAINLAIGFSPMFFAGKIASKQEATIRMREVSFVTFLRTLGETAQKHKGSLGPLIKKMKTYKYPKLNSLMDRLYERLFVTANVFSSWKYFSIESGSRLIHEFGDMFLKAVYSGADAQQVGNIVANNLNRLIQIRKLRTKTAGGAVGEVYGAFAGVAMALFITAGLAGFLGSIFASADLAGAGSIGITALAFLSFKGLDVGTISFAITGMVFVHALFSAIFIKILDGGMLSGSMTHFSLMLWMMALTEVGISWIFSNLIL